MVFIQIKKNIRVKPKAKSETENENGNGNITRTVEVTPEHIKKTLQFNDSNVVQINIKYPDIKIMPSVLYQKAEKRINGFYFLAIKNFMNFCEKELYKNAAFEFTAYNNNYGNENDNNVGGGFKPFGAVITFETSYNKQDFLCIYLDINIYSGKGRGNVTRKAHIWKSGKNNIELLSPGRFVEPGKQIKNKICEYICQTMEKQIKNGEEYYKSDISSLYNDVFKHLNMKNFYLTEINNKNKNETGYSFFFPQNTLAPFDSGIVSFTVPEKIITGTSV